MPPKKVLKVAVNKPPTEIDNSVNNPPTVIPAVIPEAPSEDLTESIQASKKKVKSPEHLANLQKGRDKLKQINEEKRLTKEALAKAALEKKVALAIKQKKEIEKAYGVSSDDEVDEPIQLPIPAKKSLPKVAALPPVKSPNKKKTVRYVPIEESESEEEEIVYYKPQKAPKTSRASAAPVAPVSHNIVFY